MKSDNMSVDIGSMPPWKRELLERKRRQEEQDRRRQTDESQKMSHMPAWKRDLLRKKKNVVYMSKSVSASDVAYVNKDKSGQPHRADLTNGAVLDGRLTVTVVAGETSPRLSGVVQSQAEYDFSVTGCDTVDNGTEEEHLLPIYYNPWLKSDPEIKKRLSNRHSYHGGYLKSSDLDMANDYDLYVDDGGHILPTSPSRDYADNNFSPSDPNRNSRNDNDSVFGEEEVAYGRGFVHKLLRRFKHMSAREEYQMSLSKKFSPKRTHSSEDILDDRSPHRSSPRNHLSTGDIYDGYAGLSKQKAISVDNLISRPKSESYYSVSNHSQNSEENLIDNQSFSPRGEDNYFSQSDSEQSPGGLLCRSSSQENILEEELPRPNIVSTARSVFESIAGQQPSSKKCPAPDPPNFRSSSSSSSSVTSLLSTTHLSSVSSNDSPVADRGRSLSPVHVSLYEKRERSLSPPAQSSPDRSLGSRNISAIGTDSNTKPETTAEFKGNKLFFAAKKSEAPSKPSQKIVDSPPISQKSNNEVLEDNGDSGVVLISHKTIDSSIHWETKDRPLVSQPASSTVYRSSTTGVNHAAIVPKPQGNSDQIIRDHKKREDTAKVQASNAHIAEEESAVSKEIILGNNCANDIGENTADLKDSQKSHHVGKDTIALLPEHRNPEANRLNLNLNLNELPRKKSSEPATDINRNNKVVTHTVSEIRENGSSHDFPIPPLRNSKKPKRPASEGPGSLLIRPASNLVAAGTKTEYLVLNKYRDIKQGEFAPAKKRPSYYDEDDDDYDDDVPVTNIDDYLPVTNIDDVSPAGTPREGDPTHQRRVVRKFDFVGAGVIINRSLLTKTRKTKMNINFDDSAVATFEYPSEQSLLDHMPPEPGDFDYIDPNKSSEVVRNGSVSDEDVSEFVEPSGGLLSNPGVGSASTLGSYQSKIQVDYYFGMDRKEEEQVKRPAPPEPASNDIQPSTDDDFTWSDATTSDMLF